MQFKTTTLNRLKDNQEFYLSKRSKAAMYWLHKKLKDGYVFTSCGSGLSFKRPGKTVVYLKK